jgi:hypothetical protein
MNMSCTCSPPLCIHRCVVGLLLPQEFCTVTMFVILNLQGMFYAKKFVGVSANHVHAKFHIFPSLVHWLVLSD